MVLLERMGNTKRQLTAQTWRDTLPPTVAVRPINSDYIEQCAGRVASLSAISREREPICCRTARTPLAAQQVRRITILRKHPAGTAGMVTRQTADYVPRGHPLLAIREEIPLQSIKPFNSPKISTNC